MKTKCKKQASLGTLMTTLFLVTMRLNLSLYPEGLIQIPHKNSKKAQNLPNEAIIGKNKDWMKRHPFIGVISDNSNRVFLCCYSLKLSSNNI